MERPRGASHIVGAPAQWCHATKMETCTALHAYGVLFAVLAAAVFAMPLVGFVDPFALLMRGLTFWAIRCWYPCGGRRPSGGSTAAETPGP